MHRLKKKVQHSYHLGKTNAHRFHRHPAGLPLLLFIALVTIGAGFLVGFIFLF